MASDGFTASSSVGLKRYEINAPPSPVGDDSLAVHSTGLLLSDVSFTKSTETCLRSQEEHSV